MMQVSAVLNEESVVNVTKTRIMVQISTVSRRFRQWNM